MPVVRDPRSHPTRRTTIYPAPFNQGFDKRGKRALTEALGLTQFGINLTTLEPGGQSAHRHWHAAEDEAIYVVEGTLTLVTDDGEHILTPGMMAGFPAGLANGHHLINRGSEPGTYLEMGTRARDDDVIYSDIDLQLTKRDGQSRFTRKTGEPLP